MKARGLAAISIFAAAPIVNGIIATDRFGPHGLHNEKSGAIMWAARRYRCEFDRIAYPIGRANRWYDAKPKSRTSERLGVEYEAAWAAEPNRLSP
jgi:hypothetical protein